MGSTTTAGGTQPAPEVISSLIADLVVLRTWSLLSGAAAGTRTAQLGEFDLTTWTMMWSTVLRLPSCRHCAPGLLNPPAVIG